MILREYQQRAVQQLTAKGLELLARPERRQKLVFKAPTGSGKTVMMAEWLQQMTRELPGHYELSSRQITYLWIAPNQLHEQSLWKLKEIYAGTRTLHCRQFEDLTDPILPPGNILFFNWQTLSRENAIILRENETDNHLTRILTNTRLQGMEIIAILDEAHLFASRGNRARQILELIDAKIEVDVSATPLNASDDQVVIRRTEVIRAEMIKTAVQLNAALQKPGSNQTLDEYLLTEAYHKRNELERLYQNEKSPVRPLLLIQLPDASRNLSSEDRRIRSMIEQSLDRNHNVNEANGKLAVWLSEEKSRNLENISDFASPVEVLLFKQAIALGWDCPRAAVLLIFRDIKSETFTIQTVGRILRMPEQRHYHNSMLNNGYVYTNLAKERIQVVADDMDYLILQRATRIPQYQSIGIQTSRLTRHATRNRLGSGFRSVLYNVLKNAGLLQSQETPDYLQQNQAHLWNWNLQPETIHVEIPRDIHLSGETQTIWVEQHSRYARTEEELSTLLYRFCLQCTGDFARTDSAPVLQHALLNACEDFLGLDELNAIRVLLANDIHVQALVDQALQNYRQKLNQQNQITENPQREDWDVPLVRLYPEGQFHPTQTHRHVLQAFFESVRASEPEKRFIHFLEKHSDHLRWWYKNGDSGPEHFAIPYSTPDGKKHLFYVDFILLLKDGTVCLFDTKTIGSDANAASKHNALHDYLQELRQRFPERRFLGGIIIEDRQLWKYSRSKIADHFTSLNNWDVFDPTAVIQTPDFDENQYEKDHNNL